MHRALFLSGLLFPGLLLAQGTSPNPPPGTAPLEEASGAERSIAMVAGIDRFVMRETGDSVQKRAALWHRDFASPQAYEHSIAENRAHLRRMLGLREED